MKILKKPVYTAILSILLFTTTNVPSHAQNYTYTQDGGTPPLEADNTGVNIRDRNAYEVTADRQPENEADRDLIQRIRKEIVANKSFSSYARNIKIISRNGTVTLKGPVRSESEKMSILDKTRSILGTDNIVDEISIQPRRNRQ